CGYPVNHLIEYAANADIRPVMVRQERIGIHMADAISRVTSGRTIGAFCMQHGPGAENAYGGVAQCYGESMSALVVPQGLPDLRIDLPRHARQYHRRVLYAARPGSRERVWRRGAVLRREHSGARGAAGLS